MGREYTPSVSYKININELILLEPGLEYSYRDISRLG